MLWSTLISLALLSVSLPSSAVQIRDSPVTIPLVRRLQPDGLRNLVRRDLERVNTLIDLHSGNVPTKKVTDTGVGYTASVGVGSPPTYSLMIKDELIVDTGSSNTWVGAKKKYVATKTSVKTEDTVTNLNIALQYFAYGEGFFAGNEYLDTVTITDGIVITNQSIGVATSFADIDVDGILGQAILGPIDLTLGTLSPSKNETIPTVTDNAYAQGLICSPEIGIYFEPYTNESQIGEISWGGADTSRYTGEMTFAPVTLTPNASHWWGIDQTIRYGASDILLSASGIVDTGKCFVVLHECHGLSHRLRIGTTLLYLITEAFDAYQKATGGVLDDDTGLLRITPSQYANLQSLFFTINGVDFELTPNAQLWPRAFNTLIGGSNDFLYLVAINLDVSINPGFNFVNGYVFLERYYTVFDTANQRVGFAKTQYTYAETN
ncbi:hypothetical protein H0H92_008112 [Tricholoma furcatifolium]|nr:hypothetical protein H0H92_008112 [Tricholoma furcatifolium]